MLRPHNLHPSEFSFGMADIFIYENRSGRKYSAG